MNERKIRIKKETIVNLQPQFLKSVKGGTYYLSFLPGVQCATSGNPETYTCGSMIDIDCEAPIE